MAPDQQEPRQKLGATSSDIFSVTARNLSPKRWWSDTWHRGEVGGQSRDWYSLDDGAAFRFTWSLRLWSSAFLVLRLRCRQRAVRVRLEPVGYVDHPKNRQRFTEIFRRGRVRRFHFVRRRRLGACPRQKQWTMGTATVRLARKRARLYRAALLAADRRVASVRIERWTDKDAHQSLALDLQRQYHNSLR